MQFYNEIKSILTNNSFDIYKLHSDFDNGFTSTAAYIINNKSISKILDNHKIILGQTDFDLYVIKMLNKITMLTHSYNIFITDEKESTNRKEIYNALNLLDNIYLGNRCDKNLKQMLSFKVFRIHNYEIIVFELILIIPLIISIICKS